MSSGHQHVSSAHAHRGALQATLLLTLLVLVVQGAAGWWSGSLALLADAGHSLSDVAAVAAALAAVWWAHRPASSRGTFGRWRVETLAAAANAVLLLGVAGWVLVEAVGRWADPRPVDGWVMVAAAVVTLGLNSAGVLLLRRGAQESLTVRGAYLEVWADAVGSLFVLLSGVVVALSGFVRADTAASAAIAVLIVPRALHLLRDAWSVFSESAPKEVDVVELRQHLVAQPGVIAVHDLHVWTITSGMVSVTAHVVVDPELFASGQTTVEMLDRLQACLSSCFRIEHCTFQLEPPGLVEAHLHR